MTCNAYCPLCRKFITTPKVRLVHAVTRVRTGSAWLDTTQRLATNNGQVRPSDLPHIQCGRPGCG